MKGKRTVKAAVVLALIEIGKNETRESWKGRNKLKIDFLFLHT